VVALADRWYAKILLGDITGAETDVNVALASDNNNIRAINYRGLIHLNRGQLDDAIKDFNAAVTINNHYADAYLNLAKAYLKKGDKTNAQTTLNRALELSPNNPDGLNLKKEIDKTN
jgi:tetratricopeptide (TPR) repeat protein